MYGHPNTQFPRAAASELLTQFPPPQLTIPDHQLGSTEFDSVHEVFRALNSDVVANSSSSGCSSYDSPSSLASYCTQSPSFIPRSVSSHSLHINCYAGHQFVESENSPVRRVFSAGDLQRINMMQPIRKMEQSSLWNENSIIIEGMGKACRYSPEEKKERIERYRNKKNLRNFNKKIKYACRKTLADSRPRIRGRFARNEEIEKNTQNEYGEEDEEDYDNYWINFIDAFSNNLIP